MKQKIFRITLLAILIALLIFTNIPFWDRSETTVFTLPGLPRPIAKGPIVITSAGQSTDTYIISDISNQLMISSFFMPQARDLDVKDIETIVFVVGYSSLGMKLQDVSFSEEESRIEKLLKAAEGNDMKIVMVVIGGVQSKDKKTEELLKLIGSQTDYIIGLRKSSNVGVLAKLSEEMDIPLTLVSSVSDISGPFASAFR